MSKSTFVKYDVPEKKSTRVFLLLWGSRRDLARTFDATRGGAFLHVYPSAEDAASVDMKDDKEFFTVVSFDSLSSLWRSISSFVLDGTLCGIRLFSDSDAYVDLSFREYLGKQLRRDLMRSKDVAVSAALRKLLVET